MQKLQLQGRASVTVLDVAPREADPSVVEGELARIDPGAVLLDISPRDALRVRRGRPLEGWSGAWAAAAGDAKAMAAVYARALAWGDAHDAEIIPVGPDDRPGWRNRRALAAAVKAVGHDPAGLWLAARADLRLRAALDDRSATLAHALERVLGRELPRPAAIMTAPFGRHVARAVQARWGLVAPGAPGGGWPA